MKLRLFFVMLLAAVACSDSGTTPDQHNSTGSTNHRPVMTELPDTSIVVGNVLVLQASATDPDGDNLSFHGSISTTLTDVHAGTLPQFYFSPSAHTMTFTPQTYDKPARSAILWAEDGHGGIDTMVVHIEIN